MPGMVTSHRACRYFFGLGLYSWTTSLIYSIQQNRWDSIGCPTHVAAKIQAWRLFLFSTSWSAHPVSFLNRKRCVSHGPTKSPRVGVLRSKSFVGKYMQMHRQPTPFTSPWSCLFPKFVVTWPWVHESMSTGRKALTQCGSADTSRTDSYLNVCDACVFRKLVVGWHIWSSKFL